MNSRKVVHILLSVFLLVATTGMSMHEHFCKGNLVSISVLEEQKSCCEDNCPDCTHEVVQVKVENEYAQPENIHIPQLNPGSAITLYTKSWVALSTSLSSFEQSTSKPFRLPQGDSRSLIGTFLL